MRHRGLCWRGLIVPSGCTVLTLGYNMSPLAWLRELDTLPSAYALGYDMPPLAGIDGRIGQGGNRGQEPLDNRDLPPARHW